MLTIVIQVLILAVVASAGPGLFLPRRLSEHSDTNGVELTLTHTKKSFADITLIPPKTGQKEVRASGLRTINGKQAKKRSVHVLEMMFAKGPGKKTKDLTVNVWFTLRWINETTGEEFEEIGATIDPREVKYPGDEAMTSFLEQLGVTEKPFSLEKSLMSKPVVLIRLHEPPTSDPGTQQNSKRIYVADLGEHDACPNQSILKRWSAWLWGKQSAADAKRRLMIFGAKGNVDPYKVFPTLHTPSGLLLTFALGCIFSFSSAPWAIVAGLTLTQVPRVHLLSLWVKHSAQSGQD